MSDQIFQRENVKITKTMAVFGDTSYPIANIGAVTTEDDPSGWYGLVVVGLILGAIGFFADDGSGLVVFGIIAIVIGVWLGNKFSGKKLMLRTSSGNEQAYSSTNAAVVDQIKAAIERAVSERG